MQLCRSLLCVAKHVKLVDPHFDLNSQRFREPLARFVECLPDSACIDIFVEGHAFNARSAEHLHRGANSFLPRILHRGMQVRLWWHSKGKMHNRYVLTPLGGIAFGTGLDIAGENAALTDEVTLQEEHIRAELWSEYADGELIGTWSASPAE